MCWGIQEMTVFTYLCNKSFWILFGTYIFLQFVLYKQMVKC